MVELITIMIILGILSAVAIPKMNSATSFRAVEFRDKVVSALRFAQKTAVSHRRLVCVAFSSDQVTLTIDHDKDGACSQVLVVPGSNSNVVLSTDTSGVFASIPATLYFQPNGQGTNTASTAVTINASIDGSPVYVVGVSETVNLHVGSIEEMGKRFVGAWNRLERGEEVKETHLTFFNLETMMTTLSPKRLELLRHVHQHPAKTIATLAKTIRRDYKRVHDDVSALVHAGLIVRDENGIRAPYDSVQATVSLDA